MPSHQFNDVHDLRSPTSDAQESEGIESPHRWIDLHGDVLFRYGMMRLSDASLVEDLLQETLLAALDSKSRFNRKASVRTWLIGILRNKISDHFRKQSKETKKVSTIDLESVQAFPERTERLMPWQGDPAEIFENAEFWTVFRRCTSKLPKRVAKAFVAREIDGASVESVCSELEISSDNLATRIYRARLFLRDCLDKNWFNPEGGTR